MKQYHLQNRPDRELKNDSEITEILLNGKYAVISMCRENEPYIVTLSYGYDSQKHSLYFHCGKQGLKLDFLRYNKKVCATVIEDGGFDSDGCGHSYKTVVFWGRLGIVEDLNEKKHGMNILAHHLVAPDSIMNIKEKLNKSDDVYSKMEILRLDIEQIHRKARKKGA